MTESQFQAKLLKALRDHPALKDAVIFKHSDRFNGGIPDISVTVKGVTTWIELKVYPNKLSKLQEYYLRRLQRAACVVYKEGKDMAIAIIANDIAIRCLN